MLGKEGQYFKARDKSTVGSLRKLLSCSSTGTSAGRWSIYDFIAFFNPDDDKLVLIEAIPFYQILLRCPYLKNVSLDVKERNAFHNEELTFIHSEDLHDDMLWEMISVLDSNMPIKNHNLVLKNKRKETNDCFCSSVRNKAFPLHVCNVINYKNVSIGNGNEDVCQEIHKKMVHWVKKLVSNQYYKALREISQPSSNVFWIGF